MEFILFVLVVLVIIGIFKTLSSKTEKGMDIDTIIKEVENGIESSSACGDSDRVTAYNYYLPPAKNLKKGELDGCFKSFENFLRVYIDKKIKLKESDIVLLKYIWLFFTLFRNITNRLPTSNKSSFSNTATLFVWHDKVDFIDFLQTIEDFGSYCKETNQNECLNAIEVILKLLYEIINVKEIFESITYPKESWKKTFGENAFANAEKAK